MSGDIQFFVEYDNNSVLEIFQPINSEKIKNVVKEIERVLLDSGAKPRKVKDIFEVSVEMLQNILYYSYGNREDSNHKREADGTFKVIYSSDSDVYTIVSENIVKTEQKEKILERVSDLHKLDDKGIRKLIREKMRSGESMHENGAGIGLLVIAKKSSTPLSIEFSEIFQGLEKFTLTVKV